MVTREALQRMVIEAGEIGGERGALIALSKFTPHDLTTHAGQKAFAADNDFVYATRLRCSRVREKAFMYFLGYGTLGAILIVVFSLRRELGDILIKVIT